MEMQLKITKSAIYRSLIKNGYSNFKLEILEYCDKSIVIAREQYYIDRLKPEYNISLIAGASMGGRKHSEESIQKISNRMKANINARGGKGRKRAEGAGSPSVQIEVIDMETGIKTTYPSMSETAQALGVPSGSIRMYFSRNLQRPFKGKYLLQKIS